MPTPRTSPLDRLLTGVTYLLAFHGAVSLFSPVPVTVSLAGGVTTLGFIVALAVISHRRRQGVSGVR